MFNRKLFIAAAVFGLASVAYAGNQNDAGCGLGSQLFKENKPVHQIVAATTTTNGTSTTYARQESGSSAPFSAMPLASVHGRSCIGVAAKESRQAVRIMGECGPRKRSDRTTASY